MRLTEYSLRMNKVLDHIDRHLGDPLELDMLADVAHFSRFHFHRVFSSWVGEAFARAFKTRFGCTPTVLRAETPRRLAESVEAARKRRRGRSPGENQSNFDQASVHDNRHNDDFIVLIQEPAMQVEIVELPSVKVTYMRQIGPYGPKIGEFWRESFAPWLAANGLLGEPCYGIGHDDPGITPPDHCRYDACVEVPEGFAASGRINVATLPGGRYAVTKFQGNPETIDDVWVELFRDWLPRSGFRCDARPCFEYYPRNWKPDPEGGTFACDICIPVTTV